MARGAIPVEDDSGGLQMAMTDGGRRIEAASDPEMAAPGRTLAEPRAGRWRTCGQCWPGAWTAGRTAR